MTVNRVQKVYAYITCEARLLVFSHPDYPEAGLQVPGGTVESGETLESAIMREAEEETGLTTLQLAAYLGRSDFYSAQERHFFHLICPPPAPSAWTHWETHAHNSDESILFNFYWDALENVIPDLVADHGIFLEELMTRL